MASTTETTKSDVIRSEGGWADMGQKSLLRFTVYTFREGRYRVHWHHQYKAAALELWADKSFPILNRLALSEPPRHGKTMLASVHLPAWILGRHPSESVIAASRDARYAKRISRKVKQVIKEPTYGHLFPRTKIPTKHVRSNEREQFKNTAKHWQIVGHGGEYEAFGATQGISGVGAEWLLVEDPYPSREKAESTAYRNQVNQWYDDDLRPRRESTLATDKDLSSILIIHTRWHQNDLIGHVISKAREHAETDDYVWLNFPGIRMDGNSVGIEFAGQSQLQRRKILEAFDAKGIPVDYEHETLIDPREYDEALWPDRRDAGDYIAERKTNTRKFWSLDQGQPTPPGGAIFEREWFESDDPDTDLRRWDYLPGSGEYIWTMDPKHGSKEPESSEVVVQLWYRPEDQASAYFVAERRGRWSEPETEEHLLELADDPLWARADAKYIEPEGDGQAIIDNLQSEIPGLQAIDTDKVRRGKKARARSIARYVKSGQVLLPPTKVYDDAPSLVDQLIKFPGAEHDDRVDCFCYAADYLLRDRDDDTDGGSYLDQYPDARDALR